jgi:hypothetical protein
MSQGFIDSASIYEIVRITEQPNANSIWALRSVVELTCLLITSPYITMAPAPGKTAPASGPYGILMEGLIESNLLRTQKLEPVIEKRALELTKRWVKRNPDKIHSAYEALKADQGNFGSWLDWCVTRAWPEHATRLGGLLNPELIPQIAQVLHISENRLADVHKLSCNPKFVADYASRQPDNDDFRDMRDAYVISALIRGRFHDYTAPSALLQIMHHPVRSAILAPLRQKGMVQFEITNVQYHLSSIIVAAALKEKDQQQRIRSWIENVRLAKGALNTASFDLEDPPSQDKVIEKVVDIAKRIHLRTYSRLFDDVLGYMLGLGIGSLASIVLHEYAGLVLTPLAEQLARKANMDVNIARMLTERKGRLRDLARFAPGRIERIWG